MFHTFLEGSFQARNVLRREFENRPPQIDFWDEATVISLHQTSFSKMTKLQKVPLGAISAAVILKTAIWRSKFV